MKKRRSLKAIAVLSVAVGAGGLHTTAEAATRVLLNGQPLATSVEPVRTDGRTLVPMRDIFEALGATVVWNGVTQEIRAQSDSHSIWLQIGNRTALVDGRQVLLDKQAVLFRGSTMVPLRFVSESLGANVDWDAAGQQVRIVALPRPAVIDSNTVAPPATQTLPVTPSIPDTQPLANQPVEPAGQAVAGVRTISIPAGAVVPVTLDRTISSANARVGETFTATVSSQRLGDSEFPAGTKLEGLVVEARPRTKESPGVLDFDFRSATLPDGTRYNVRGDLISLDNDSVTMTQGRVMAREQNNRDKNERVKIVGVGAAAGFVLGKVFDTNTVISTVLGAAGGYLYSRSRDKNRVAEAVVPQGTRIGVRLQDPVGYDDTFGYADYRLTYLQTQ